MTGLSDGKIESSSKDAITGNQLNDLATKIGVEVNGDKSTFTQPSFYKN